MITEFYYLRAVTAAATRAGWRLIVETLVRVAAALPFGYRGRRRVRRGQLSTMDVAAHARAAREAELVELALRGRTRRGSLYGTVAAGYRRLALLEKDTAPLWRGRGSAAPR